MTSTAERAGGDDELSGLRLASLTPSTLNMPTSLLLYWQSAPPNVVFAMFQADCAARGLTWYSSKAQQLALDWFVRHSVSKHYPPRYSSLRSLLKCYISRIEEPHIMEQRLGEADKEGGGDPVLLGLMEAYIALSVSEKEKGQTMCYKTFVNPFITVRGGVERFLTRAHAHGEDARYRKYREAVLHALICPVRVSNKQYSNVGLSLWAAAFVLVQLLAQELKETTRLLADQLFPNRGAIEAESASSTAPLHETDKLHMLELGAGVGLTPILLHRMPSYRRYVSTFVLSDYMPELIENITFNLEQNEVTVVKDLHAAAMGLEGEKRPPFHTAVQLDWTSAHDVESMLVDWGSDVVLAADCIYDVKVIPALAHCIHLALTVPLITRSIERCILSQRKLSNNSLSSLSLTSGSPGPRLRTPVCIVVQTHRQNSTMKCFFDEVRRFATVRSFSLVRGTLAELQPRLSAGLDGSDGGVIPLEDWHLQPAEMLQDRDRVFCALQPDEVLEDGSLRSMQQSPSLMSTLSALHSDSMSYESAQSCTRDNVNIDAVLRDEMIGPFYVPMAGLIGVHILQCKDVRATQAT